MKSFYEEIERWRRFQQEKEDNKIREEERRILNIQKELTRKDEKDQKLSLRQRSKYFKSKESITFAGS